VGEIIYVVMLSSSVEVRGARVAGVEVLGQRYKVCGWWLLERLMLYSG
jgi:hypothetical protein